VLRTRPTVLTGTGKLLGIVWRQFGVARGLARRWSTAPVLHTRHSFVANRVRWDSPAEVKQTLRAIKWG